MKKFGIVICWILLIGAIATAGFLSGRLPAVNEGMAAQVYAGWSGVIRVWVSGGWSPGGGNFVPWINTCAARFEKKHPGVYIQTQGVSEELLAGFLSAAIAPDAILFAPGMLPSGAGLTALAGHETLRESVRASGMAEGALRAEPVAMGGYAWALNQSLVKQVPYDWSTLEDLEPIKKQARYLVQAPKDQPYLSWSGALNALCAPRTVTSGGGAGVAAGEDLDLGLPQSTEPTPTPEPLETETVLCRLPKLLPEDFRAEEEAYSLFTSGRVAAIPVTQREIRRLQLLSESGRAPNWTVEAGGGAFTDQLLMMGIVEIERKDAQARRALASAFLDWLLTEDSQAALSEIRALRVTQGPKLYAGQPGMAQLEQATSGVLATPNAFDWNWRARESAEADRLERDRAP